MSTLGKYLFLFAALMVVGPASAAETDWLYQLGFSEEVPILALPEKLGREVGVTSRAGAYNIYQTIVFTGDAGTSGQNQIEVNLTRESLAPRATDWDIRQEMSERLPGIPMKIMDTAGRNHFGIFGFATGTGGGMNCTYAWQGVDRADAALGLPEPGFFSESHALTIRIRFCSSTISAQEIAYALQGLDVASRRGTSSGLSLGNTAPHFGADALSLAEGRGQEVLPGLLPPLKPVPLKMAGQAVAAKPVRKPKKRLPPANVVIPTESEMTPSADLGFAPIPLPDESGAARASQADSAQIGASSLAIPMPVEGTAKASGPAVAVPGAGSSFIIPMPDP